MDDYHATHSFVNSKTVPEIDADLFGHTAAAIEARYPESPGSKAPGTSQEAAAAIAPSVKRCHGIILQELASAGDRGLTADEVAKLIERSPFFVRPRFSELRAKGAIVPVGIRRPR
jgi:hypothetical protein